MAALILLIGLTILSWVACWAAYKGDNFGLQCIFAICGTLLSTGLLFAVVGIAVKASDADYFVEDRQRHEEIIHNIGPDVSTETMLKIYNDAIEDNKKILTHRKHVDSKFSGVFYSRKIAECELIVIPELNIIKE